MAFFALLWKARTIEKYRQNYEKEKINSIVMGHTQMEQTLSQRWRHYRYDTQKRISRTFKRWYPDGSGVANFFLYLRTDQTFPNFLLKSMMGFVGGIILTYLCFMFFVFQLSISLIHATIMSSIIGVLLTLGLAFSYRIRCLVFLLIPQFFSRVGRYTLTCYALVLILTGPATNTLKNSEVLSESMACSQEQIKTSVHQLNDLMKKPYNSMKDSIKLMIERLKAITMKVKETVVKFDRLVLSIVSVIQSSFSWLQSVADICNAKLGTPYDRCTNVLQDGISECKKTLGPDMSTFCNVAYVAQAACYSVKPFKAFCYVTDFMDEAILASIKKKLRNFTEHLRAMFHVEVHIHQSYSYSSNTSRSASQVAAGIVTEIRNRADPLLTWLSWSSCVTSLFLLLIIFRAKYYQHMYETRSRFDNRYVTKELQELDLKRQRQGRETILPLNRRERAKYITTSSFRLVASEKVYLNRSAVFMAITTFKLLIHMVADYSLYWVLMTIRYHGRYQSDLMPGIPHSGVHVSGSGFVARLFRSIVGTLDIPLAAPSPSPISCLPNPYPPDFRRYTQIGVLIFLLWFFALFEPYGLRLRHLIMGLYRPERAKARATWLYNHILRTRAGFMKFARRKLHREYKYSSEASLTLRQWVEDHIPFQCLKSLLGLSPKELHCLLCGATCCPNDPDSKLTKCGTPNCPGIYCSSCFADIGQLCTICLTPADYGDLSDVSLEKGSSDDSDSEGGLGTLNPSIEYARLLQNDNSNRSLRSNKSGHRRWQFFTKTGPTQRQNTIALLATKLPNTYIDDQELSNTLQSTFRRIKRNMQIRTWEKKYTRDWIAKLSPEYMYKDFSTEDSNDFYSDILDIEQNYDIGEIVSKTKSIGINTDKNRGILLNAIVNSFSRRKIKRPHANKQKKSNACLTSDKEVLFHFENGAICKEHCNFTTNGHILKLNAVNPKKRSLIPIKKFHGHKLATRHMNVIKVVRTKKKQKTKYEIKIFKAVNGIIKTIRTLANSNDQITAANQNNDTAPNRQKTPIENNAEITETSDNTGFDGKRNNKKSSKSYKSKRPGKQKGVVKLKTKNSRHRIAEFHTFFSKHWNNIKYSIIPCTSTQTRSETPMPKEKRNHKRRKKRKTVDFNDKELEQCFAKKDIKHTRNLRISAFLAELEWTKRDYRKDKDCDGNDDSFFFTDGVPAPITTNKIVGMVQLKNLPFQWREAPRYEFCQCQDKKCSCGNDTSDKHFKLFAPMSKQKVYAKKALERFRNKINTAVDTTPSCLVQKMMSTMNVARNRSPLDQDSSICISKRTSFYRQFTQELNQDSDAIDTDMLFKNENFLDDFLPDLRDSNQMSTSKYSTSNTFLGQELIVSRSSKDNKKPRITRRCRCDVYEDLQRRWTHVKKTLSDRGFRNPLNIMKNFCSSLFGPSCTIDTCPNKREKKERVKQDKAKAKAKKKESKLKANTKKKKSQTGTQTIHSKKQTKKSQMASQTQSHKDTETQLASESEVDVAKELEMQCEKEREMLRECEEKYREKLAMERQRREEEKRLEKERQEEERLENRRKEEERLEREREEEERLNREREEEERLEREREEEERDKERHVHAQTLVRKTKDSETATGISGRDGDDEATGRGSDLSNTELEEKRLTLKSQQAEHKKEHELHEKTMHVQHPEKVHKGIHVEPEMASGACQAVDCPNFCHRSMQYDDNDYVDTKAAKPGDVVQKSKDIGSVKCYCDATSQVVATVKTVLDEEIGTIKAFCTCATQHISTTNRVTVGTKPSPIVVESITYNQRSPVANKKTQRNTKQVAHKGTHYVARRTLAKKGKDVKTGVSRRRHKLSLESSLCVFEKVDRNPTVTKTMQDTLTDTVTDTSLSSLSLRSDETKTDTTICSLATIDYDDTPRRRKFRVKVITKTNQATLTDKTRLCDTGTITNDWWSPIVERRAHDEILLEKKKGYNTIEKQKKELRELKELKELREVRKRRRNCGMTTDGRIVTFRSRTQIIPTGLFPGTNDIMSPSRYLLESQKYYNELFAYNFRPPPQVEYTCVTQMPKYQEREKIRSPRGSRRNHYYKTKRLDECYSPRRQISPRKWYPESINTKTSDSPRRRSYTHRHTKNIRYNPKLNSPRKIV